MVSTLRRGRRSATVGTTGLVLVTAVCLAAPPAVAGPFTDPSKVSGGLSRSASADVLPSPASSTPLPTAQIDGVVWAQATVGDTVYAVGSFANARPAGAAPGTQEVPRANILAYDIRTGVLSTTFVHTLNAQAKTITASPDGSRIYVGGQFTTVDGQSRPRVAAFSTATGALLAYAPAPNYIVETIAVTSSTVYLGGSFASVGGATRNRLAATDTNGSLLSWAPSATGTVRGLVAVPAQNRVYVAGSFSSLNGVATNGVSAVNSTSGASVSVPVSSEILASYADSNSSGVYTLRTDGTRIYGGGYNDGTRGQFEGTFAMDPASGSTLWVNDCWGDTYDTEPIGGALFVASHAHDCSAPGFFADDGSSHRYGVAYGLVATSNHNVRDPRGWDYTRFPTSAITAWRPYFAQGSVANQSVWSFTGNSAYVAAAGEFPRVSGTAQQGLVRFKLN